MANLTRQIFRACSKTSHHGCLSRLLTAKRNDGEFSQTKRHLFSKDILGIENFLRQRTLLENKVGEQKEFFFSKMEEYMASPNKSTIFTDDLKTTLYISDNEEELKTTVSMIQRYNSQQGDLRFTNFVFGPLVIRLLHHLQKPDLAYALFMDKSLSGFFDQMSSFVALMDLQFECGHYDRVLEIMDVVKEKGLGGFSYPMDCVTVTLASLLKMNSPESFQKMTNLMKELKQQDIIASSRSVCYATFLALKQNQPETALEIITLTANIPERRLPKAVYNLQAMTYANLGRAELALQILRAELEKDVPEHMHRGEEIFQEVAQLVEDVVAETDNKELIMQCQRVTSGLQAGNHISEQDMETYLFRPLVRRRQLQDGYKSRDRSSGGGFKRQGGRRDYARPGLRGKDELSY